MNKAALVELFEQVASGALRPADAAERLRMEPYQELLNGLCLDHHRELRTGQGEVVLAAGKSPELLGAAVRRLHESGARVLATRVSPEQGRDLSAAFPQGAYWPEARLFCLGSDLALNPPWPDAGDALIVTAGAADMPVAMEALGCARFFGLRPGVLADVGVAGLHRLTPRLPVLFKARLLVVIAGMEGALPSVLAGMTGCPVVAVPTSTGYGAGAGGFAALLAMLNSCAPGVSVMNIDNGYGAAAFAAKLLLP